MTVFVSQEFIDQGKRNHTSACPLALAIKSKLRRAASVHVGSTYVIVDDNELVMDNETWKAVDKFDKTGKMKPFKATF